MMQYINEHQDDSPRSDVDKVYIQQITEQLESLTNQLKQEIEQSILLYILFYN